MRVRTWAVATAVAVVVAASAAVLVASSGSSGPGRDRALPSSWEGIVADAQGETVHLWMWGGEVALNRYVDDQVVPAAAAAGVDLERVPVDDTATAVAQVAAELEGGREHDGSVDLVWINGVNFAQGRAAGLWLEGWAGRIPNARLLDPDDPTLTSDFGVPTEGDELPWSRAAFVFAYDEARVADPPRSLAELTRWVRDHPGRFTYPAPPDFTGSAFVRQAVQSVGEEEAFRALADMRPFLWAEGRAFPRDQPELDRLFADGEVDLAMSYNPNFVDVGVERGAFPPSTRPFVFGDGSLQNVSNVAIPRNASSPSGAQVVADLLLSPALQAAKLDLVGIPSVLDPGVLPRARAGDGDGTDPHRLDGFGTPLPELPVARVGELDERWRAEVLR